MPCVDRDLKDAPRFGRSVEADEDQIIKTLVEANRRITTRKIAANLHDLIKLFFFIKKKMVFHSRAGNEITFQTIHDFSYCSLFPICVTQEFLKFANCLVGSTDLFFS